MKIELHEIKIRDIVEGYQDNAEYGVVGYKGLLNIRPAYQREFVYDDVKRSAVINSINHKFPLNVMYWIKKEDGTFEMLDGQQRTLSFCQYYDNGFSFENRMFHNLPKNLQDEFLEYKCMIYFCEGTESEQLEWFKIINIAGEKLTAQELRNAIYTGKWLTDAKRHFSKNNCAGYNQGKDYITGEPIRQDYLEKVLGWIADRDKLQNIEAYMSKHQHDDNCNDLWLYYCNVISWIQTIFPKVRKEMKGLPWGIFYNKYKDNSYDAQTLEEEIKKLLADDDVTSKKGIYEYLLSREEKHLNIRAFTDTQKAVQYEKQKGICPICKKHFDISEMEGDHIKPWCEGGKTEPSNLQMLCKDCNRHKSSK